VLGALLSLIVPAYRPALLPFLVALVLIAVSAMLVGDVPRYRYPVDPLMYVMAAGGLLGLASLIVRAARGGVVRSSPLTRTLSRQGVAEGAIHRAPTAGTTPS
jgi:hypothetical protein